LKAPPPDAGSSILEMLVALAILAAATTMIVSTMTASRVSRADPVEQTNTLLVATRAKVILSGEPVVVRLHTDSVEIGKEHHAFSSPMEFEPLEHGSSGPPEITFVILPDGTRTGGNILLGFDGARRQLALISRGVGA
jgi:hypothetical protein